MMQPCDHNFTNKPACSTNFRDTPGIFAGNVGNLPVNSHHPNPGPPCDQCRQVWMVEGTALKPEDLNRVRFQVRLVWLLKVEALLVIFTELTEFTDHRLHKFLLNLLNIEDIEKIDLGKAGNSAGWLAFWKQQRNAGSADEREEEQ